MNDLQIFSNAEFGEIRTINLDGTPWFVGKDVAVILGYSNSRKAIIDHVDEEDKGVTKCDTPKTCLYFTLRGRINDSLPYPAYLLYPNSRNRSTGK